MADTEFGKFLATKGEGTAMWADHPAWVDMPSEAAKQLMDHFKDAKAMGAMSTRSKPIVFTFFAEEGYVSMRWGTGLSGVEEVVPVDDEEEY